VPSLPVYVGIDVACAVGKRLPVCVVSAGHPLMPLTIPTHLATLLPRGRGGRWFPMLRGVAETNGLSAAAHLRQRQVGWQHGLGGCTPRKPCHLHRLRPEREWVGAVDEAAERLEGGHGLQVDRYLLGITALTGGVRPRYRGRADYRLPSWHPCRAVEWASQGRSTSFSIAGAIANRNLFALLLERWGQNQPESFETFDASLDKSVAGKFRGDTRVECFRRREIGAAAFRIVLVPQAGETAAIK
jgi:hypothetical protein